ncbi:hypothetical protein JI752_007395 [Lysobacter sp. MMG2]|uniref:hypothetical protein n=1 Tax=Lysobacter sp. MMG2 TaxID=2801338 RepID=UPI001C250E92|nr:hypothetical protein [Lysobacter sp. MMG2]MBU8975966.1 hypothetical protein [Lysobacter sp. MMG2]
MDLAQGTRWEAALAAGVAVTVTFGMFWSLARLMRPAPVPAPARVAATSIEVTWIVRPSAPTDDVRHESQRRAARTTGRATAPPARDARSVNEPETPTANAPTGGRTLSAVYLSQARAEPVAPTSADPFANRSARLPGEGRERFRMRTQTSVATVVNGIGRMFGGRDPDEPCRENRRNIGDLALDGDSAALQQQLDYERRLCRP